VYGADPKDKHPVNSIVISPAQQKLLVVLCERLIALLGLRDGERYRHFQPIAPQRVIT